MLFKKKNIRKFNSDENIRNDKEKTHSFQKLNKKVSQRNVLLSLSHFMVIVIQKVEIIISKVDRLDEENSSVIIVTILSFC